MTERLTSKRLTNLISCLLLLFLLLLLYGNLCRKEDSKLIGKKLWSWVKTKKPGSELLNDNDKPQKILEDKSCFSKAPGSVELIFCAAVTFPQERKWVVALTPQRCFFQSEKGVLGWLLASYVQTLIALPLAGNLLGPKGRSWEVRSDPQA